MVAPKRINDVKELNLNELKLKRKQALFENESKCSI